MSRQIEVSDTAAVLIFDEGDLPGAFDISIPEGEPDEIVPMHAHIAAAIFRWIPMNMEQVAVMLGEYFDELEQFVETFDGGEDEGTEGQEEEGDRGAGEADLG